MWVLCLLGAMGLLWLAAYLQPHPSGLGTHMQLGLPPCGFWLVTHQPCPACGLSTAFAHLIRAQIIAAWHANPWGIFLFAIVLLSVFVSLEAAIQAASLRTTLRRFHVEKICFALAALGIVFWLQRLTF